MASSTAIAAAVLLVTLSASLVTADNGVCYNLFGQQDDSLKPCDPNADVSACCRSDDICLSSGLCMSTASSWAGFIWANGCTDATHADRKCPNQCAEKTAVNASSSFNVLQCTYPFSNGSVSLDPQWCCRSATDYDNCCNNADLVFNDTQSIGLFLTPGSTNAMHPAEAYIPAADCNTNNNNNNNATAANAAISTPLCPANHTAAVGGAVGGVLGALLIGALATIAFLLLRGRQSLTSPQTSSTDPARDNAFPQPNNEKTHLSRLTDFQQQQQQQPQHAAAAATTGPTGIIEYQKSTGAFGHGGTTTRSSTGYGGGHVYSQYNNNNHNNSHNGGDDAWGARRPDDRPPAEMSATKFVEMDDGRRQTATELSVQEVQPTPLGSVHAGSVKSKVST